MIVSKLEDWLISFSLFFLLFPCFIKRRFQKYSKTTIIKCRRKKRFEENPIFYYKFFLRFLFFFFFFLSFDKNSSIRRRMVGSRKRLLTNTITMIARISADSYYSVIKLNTLQQCDHIAF